MAEEPKRLGRGLAALIGNSPMDAKSNRQNFEQRKAPVEFLRPNSNNPRHNFPEKELAELADSIKEKGLLQPIAVRQIPNMPNAFEIIAGERRWRAAQLAGLHDVPIIIIEASDREVLELAIIENVQRSDLNPLEEANGYEQLVRVHNYTQADVAKSIGKSRSHIANTIRLTKLPEKSKSLLAMGQISAGHARALLSVSDPDRIAEDILNKGLTVRDVEQIASNEASQLDSEVARTTPPNKGTVKKDPNTRDLERRLREALGLDVIIRHKGEIGQLVIKFTSFEQLDDISDRLNPN